MLQCMLHIGFESDEGMCNMPDSQTIKIYDNIKQKSLTFSISGVINPPNTMTTDTFVIECFDPYENMIAHTYNQPEVTLTPEPGVINFPTVFRPDAVVGSAAAESTNEISFSFLT